MKAISLIAAAAYATTGRAISVLLPLYVYPESGAWDPVYSAVSSNPSVEFVVVVNPDSGPDDGDNPGTDYASGVTQLNSHPNVRTIGYVRTNYTHRALSDVQSDISAYASWPSAQSSTSNLTLHGIFFDEAPSAATSAAETYISSAARSARSAFPGGTVVLNPGTLAPAPYFADADLVVEFEGPWSQYDVTGTPGTIPEEQRAESAIVVNEVPAGADLEGAVRSADAAGVAAVGFADDCCYNDVGLVGRVAAAVAAVQ